MSQHTLFICKSCAFSPTNRDYMEQRGDYHLWQSLLRVQHQRQLQAEYNLKAVDCLSGCNRVCAIAFAAPKLRLTHQDFAETLEPVSP